MKVYSIQDFNNPSNSNIKIIINEILDFYIHEELLISRSLYFNLLFKHISNNHLELNSTSKPDEDNKILYKKVVNSYVKIEEGVVTVSNKSIRKIHLRLPQIDLVFDILLYLYSNDVERLVSLSDEIENCLSLISLVEFFEISEWRVLVKRLVMYCKDTNTEFNYEFIRNFNWNKELICFESIVLIMNIYNIEYSLRIKYILHWLRHESNQLISNLIETDINYKKIYMYINNYNTYHSSNSQVINIINTDNNIEITSNSNDKPQTNSSNENILSINHIQSILNLKGMEMINLLPSIEKYILSSKVIIYCIICKTKSRTLKEFINSSCEVRLYHPGEYMLTYKKYSEHNTCLQDTCNRKLHINQWRCCHQNEVSEGCCMSDGRHLFTITYIN